ncbi:hypothetical protein IAQ61_001427 [Plenodomus lingam]|uniref:uncharacterized protein n=1 Tax=Leptosphaeria maculans TaxID=5022 RepID=UPI003318AFF0|nr:hypothetical protein IAQ61_001427 [Plenodomus lingam]
MKLNFVTAFATTAVAVAAGSRMWCSDVEVDKNTLPDRTGCRYKLDKIYCCNSEAVGRQDATPIWRGDCYNALTGFTDEIYERDCPNGKDISQLCCRP